MGFSTKVQLIRRKKSEQWYINFPSAVAQAMEFAKGEQVEWIIEDKAHLILHRPSAPPSPVEVKKNEKSLLRELEALIEQCRGASVQERSWNRLRSHLLSELVCLGRHTITSRILTAGGGQRDWSADYRLYAFQRFEPRHLFSVVRHQMEQKLEPERPFVVAMDDSILRKSGKTIPGASYRRDPMGPPFQVNFVRALRVLQLSAALPDGKGGARMIPIDFQHVPTLKKPSLRADHKVWAEYRQAARQTNINRKGVDCIRRLRQHLDEGQQPDRSLWVLTDGRFANGTLLKNLPQKTQGIARTRADSKLYFLPDSQPQAAGRRRLYGPPAPTPEQLRTDDSIPWQIITALAAGKTHHFRLKVLPNVRWRASSKKILQLVVIAPLGYRLRKASRLLYRQPAYLLCTDPTLCAKEILQAYIWRWDIEVNFRDEKTLLKAADAQVRHPASVQNAPALTVAAYALLLTAATNAFDTHCPDPLLTAPKWRNASLKPRPSTQDFIQRLRYELWGQAIRQSNFSDFSSCPSPGNNCQKLAPSLRNALFYASN